MKAFSILFILLFTTCAFAQDVLYVSVLLNGTPPMLLVRKFDRAISTAPYTPREIASIPLTVPGGLTDLQRNTDTQLHLYFTQAQGTKARVVRQTVDISSGVNFVPGSTKNFPANLSSIINFDTNDALSLVQKVSGPQLHTQALNAAGNLAGAFKTQPRFPFAPFGSHISEGKPFFETALWTDSATGRTGITFQNVSAPANSRSFLFTKPVIAHDISLTFPRGSSALSPGDEDIVDLIFAYLEGLPGAAGVGATATAQVTPFVRRNSRNDFSPVGNIVKIHPARSTSNPAAFQFNGIDIEPLGTAIFFLRDKPGCGNEVVLQTFNPDAMKKVGAAKIAFPCINNSTQYGLSSWNPKFKNGVSED